MGFFAETVQTKLAEVLKLCPKTLPNPFCFQKQEENLGENGQKVGRKYLDVTENFLCIIPTAI